MHQTKRSYIALALLLSLALLLTAAVGGTLAYMVTHTPSLLNTFLSGLDPTGDLIIRKEVSHPFGSDYVISSGLSFRFTVSLGEAYADKTVETSEGTKQADVNGDITVNVAPEKAVCIHGLKEGTTVSVTEDRANGFTPNDGDTKTATIQSGDNTITYTNLYAPKPADPVKLTVSGTKQLEGRDWQEGDAFTFLLEYKLAGTENTWVEIGTTTVAYALIEVQDPAFPDDPTKTVWVEKPDFDQFSFTELIQSITYEAAGQYAFRISEVDGTIGGITYDKVVSYFDVLVGDADMDGALEIQNVAGFQNAVAEKDENGNFKVEVTVNNQYAPSGTAGVTVNILKSVVSHSGQEQSCSGYTFALYDESNTLIATSGETSAAGETAITLILEAKDVGTTFHYTLKETCSGESHNGLTYDSKIYKLSVSVVDNLDGTVSAYIYETPETEPTEIEKASDGETTADDTTVPTEPDATEEPAAGTEDDLRIPEDASNTYTASFVNTYDPEDTQISFGGTKILTGRDLNAREFSFDLYATGDNFVVTEDMAPAQTVTNNAEGGFAFDAIPYSKVGTYRYVVKENAAAALGGVTYDTSVFHVIVTVTDENGILVASSVTTDKLGAASEICFRNSYKAAVTAVTLTGTKTLTGMELTSGAFRFALYSASENFAVKGAALASASNDASGQFAFESMTYSVPGTFYYVVKEDSSPQMKGMTYDDAVYGITVNVWDDGAGQLMASTTVTKIGVGEVETILFENRYTEPVAPTDPDDQTEPSKPSEPSEPSAPTTPSVPTEPSDPTEPPAASTPGVPDTPPTGDDRPVALYIALAAVSLVAIVLLLVKGKRKHG